MIFIYAINLFNEVFHYKLEGTRAHASSMSNKSWIRILIWILTKIESIAFDTNQKFRY